MLTLWPPGPGRAVDVDLQVVLVDLDLDLLGLGHHGDGRGRRVDAALRLGLRDALDAVRAALPLEDRVGAVALDREDDLLEAARLVRARAELLRLEAAPLGVAGQHPEDVARPERGLVAADALADLDDHVLAVGRDRSRRARASAPPRARATSLLELGNELAQVAVGARARRGRRAPRASACASLCGPSSSFSRRPTSAASRWSL